MAAIRANKRATPAALGIEPAQMGVPTMDRPSVAFAWFLDSMIMNTDADGGIFMTCGLCTVMVCEVEADDTLRVLLNTALAHNCEG